MDLLAEPIADAGSEHKKSGHVVEVVPLDFQPHGNADLLSVVPIWGYTAVVNTKDWEGHTKAAWVPPDSLVDTKRPEFAFLAKDANKDGLYRVRAKKLRGVLSFGLLVPAPEGANVGDDVTELLGVEHYVPEVHGKQSKGGGLVTGGEESRAPNVYCVKYDLEAGRKYAQKMFSPGELVVVHEKLHGASMRAVFHDGEMYCGSRTEWKKEFPSYDHVTVESLEPKVGLEKAKEIVDKLKNKPPKKNMWWQALENTPALRKFCEQNPDVVVYGECYGAVQDLRYGHKDGQVSFAAFDMMFGGSWVDWERMKALLDDAGVPQVPFLGMYEFDFEKICEMAEGQSVVPGANHVREGVVVRSLKERADPRLGRAVLKFVGCGYLERAK